jgi:hypothetical protein
MIYVLTSSFSVFKQSFMDGRRTFLLNLGSDELKPDGWDNLANEKPILLL